MTGPCPVDGAGESDRLQYASARGRSSAVLPICFNQAIICKRARGLGRLPNSLTPILSQRACDHAADRDVD
jgi:hypothetical protein